MQLTRSGLVLLLSLAWVTASPGQEEPRGPNQPGTNFLFGEFLLIPLRVHLLAASNAPPAHTTLSNGDIVRILSKVNSVWAQAGFHFYLESLVREQANDPEQYATNWSTGLRSASLLRLRPESSLGSNMLHVYYIKNLTVNGVHFPQANFVKDTASLRPVPGGIDEPIPRVTSHELGHAFTLPHRQDQTNLMASGTTGTWLNAAEIAQVREAARKWDWIETAPAMLTRAQALEAAGKRDDATLIYQQLLALRELLL